MNAKQKLNCNNKDVRIVYAKCVLQKSFPATYTISFQGFLNFSLFF